MIYNRFLVLVIIFIVNSLLSVCKGDSDNRDCSNNVTQISSVTERMDCMVDDIISDESQKPKKRRRRHLGFKLGTRIFFRLNIKDNVIKINQLWAHAFGFRANYDILYPVPHHALKKRDVHETLQELINQHGFDGRACIQRAMCEASKTVTPQSGIFFKLFKMIFSNSENLKQNYNGLDPVNENSLPEGVDKSKPYLPSDNCEELNSQCPLSLLELSTYTDDV